MHLLYRVQSTLTDIHEAPLRHHCLHMRPFASVCVPRANPARLHATRTTGARSLLPPQRPAGDHCSVCVPHKQIMLDYMSDWSTAAPSTSASSRPPLLELAAPSPRGRNFTPFTTKSRGECPSSLLPLEYPVIFPSPNTNPSSHARPSPSSALPIASLA